MTSKIHYQLIIPGTLVSMLLFTLVLLLITADFNYPTTASAAAEGIVHNDQAHVQASSNTNPDTPSTSTENLCRVSPNYPAEILQWCEWITLYADQHHLSPDLIAALIWQESGGNHLAYSKSGAVGLMQVMPSDGLAASFNCINGPCFASRPTITELQDPEFNISFGTKYLAQQYKRYGDLRSALKAYGPMNVGYSYADKVMAIYTQYRSQP